MVSESASHSIHICLASIQFYPDYTGTGIRFWRYLPGFQARGVRTSVFAGVSSADGRTAADGGPLTVPVDTSFRRVALPSHPFLRQATFAASFARYSRQERTRFELLHLLTIHPCGLPWIYALRNLGIPLVVSHTLFNRENQDQSPKARLLRALDRFRFRVADCVITNSESGKLALERDLDIEVPVVVIPNGVDLKRFRPASQSERLALRYKLGQPPEAEIIVFVGGLIKRKGIDTLIDAWELISANHPNARLMLVGPASGDLYPGQPDDIAAKLAAVEFRERVTLTGRVNNVEDYLRIADVFVFPSRREGLPNAVLEAYGCGLPCVISPFLGLSDELGSPGNHYILAEHRAEDIARTVSGLLVDPEKCQALGQQARSWVERNLSLENTLDSYVRLYGNLANGATLPHQRMLQEGL